MKEHSKTEIISGRIDEDGNVVSSKGHFLFNRISAGAYMLTFRIENILVRNMEPKVDKILICGNSIFISDDSDILKILGSSLKLQGSLCS